MIKKRNKALAVSEWCEPFLPQSHETLKQYLERAYHFDDYDINFVMIKLESPADLVTVAEAHNITGLRHQYEPGQYSVQVIRDLVFLVYTTEFEDEPW